MRSREAHFENGGKQPIQRKLNLAQHNLDDTTVQIPSACYGQVQFCDQLKAAGYFLLHTWKIIHRLCHYVIQRPLNQYFGYLYDNS